MAPRSSPNAQTGPFAGKFEGDVTISGHLWVGGRLIGWPWWWLQVPIVLAAGLVTLDRKGEALIKLSKGMGAAHKDFRYQLTAVGGPARDLHVAREIRADTFKIAGGTSKLKVSWQVAGVLKGGSIPASRDREKPFDEKAAQAYGRAAKALLQRVTDLRESAQRRRKR
jgi:hypothetical protein